METPGYDPDWEPDDDAPELDPDYDEDFDRDEVVEEKFFGNFQLEEDTRDDAADQAAFEAKYGFIHDCHCDEDWQSGNLGVVSVCYLGLVNDALDTLEKKIESVKTLERDVARLRIQLADRSA